MNAVTRCAMAELMEPMSPPPADPAERAARERLLAAGFVTGREPSKQAALERFVRGEADGARRDLLVDLLDEKGVP